MSSVKETRNITINGLPIKVRIRKCGHCSTIFRTKEILDDDSDATYPLNKRAKVKKTQTKGMHGNKKPLPPPEGNQFLS